MKDQVSIAIYDEDQYFSLGLKNLLLDYFSRRNISVNIDDEQNGRENHIELIFSSASEKARHLPYHLDSDTHSAAKMFFHIGTPGRCREIRGGCGWRYAGSLPRRASYDAFDEMLTGALARRSPGERLERCPSCAGKYLSSREKQVMTYLRQGFSQSQVAARMQLSVKTVHSHKRSLMQKMALKNKHDFIYWLIQ
ncbi:Nitrogen regulation protein C [Serratia proteamaculans]|uniref:Response regulator transcription factor n=1 Tax=Serratia proteamaculans TaxID=28151 RepID=A0ABS0TR30_SERPR|nr:LuxR C-terminal-related transcriptional regulator [Serratia proteamaculans]MBI6180582.1 response regulator transcription factor [Serratia proteamaculans]CAI2516005.1 Nitrogen regulation protein C [Serratia proteamaculans]